MSTIKIEEYLVYSKIFYEYKNEIGSSLQISSLHLIIDFLPCKIKIDKQKRNKDKQRSNKPNNRKFSEKEIIFPLLTGMFFTIKLNVC